MLELTRTVRFAINDPSSPPGAAAEGSLERETRRGEWNTFAGAPSMRGLGRHYELDVTCRGEADPVTGYFINIREIDHAVRSAAVPIIERACRALPSQDPAAVLRDLLGPIDAALGGTGKVARVRWRLTPYYSVEMSSASTSARLSAAPGREAAGVALLRQQFEFAASHRLHSPMISEEANLALFGKCNHPSGHGHNYRVEPCVAVPVPTPGSSAPPFTLADLERITSERVIQRFDHKHLNLDIPEFGCDPQAETSSRGPDDAPAKRELRALNPSVENIARVCFELLAEPIRQAGTGASLRSVTVWETDKTSCTYPG